MWNFNPRVSVFDSRQSLVLHEIKSESMKAREILFSVRQFLLVLHPRRPATLLGDIDPRAHNVKDRRRVTGKGA